MSSAVGVEVGRRIRTYRLAAGLTQTQLAGGRYTKAYVSAIEGGKCDTSLKALAFFAERLGVSLAELVGGTHG